MPARTPLLAGGVVILAALSLTAGCAGAPPRSPAEARSDAQTAQAVYRALKASPLYFYPALEVQVERGVAHLSGLTLDSLSYDAAPQIAGRVPGVTRVVNAIELDVGRQ
jgi:osmotically-inducible protein OsmY